MIAVFVSENQGTYRIIGEVMEWEDIKNALPADAEIIPGDSLTGWGEYTKIYRIRFPELSETYPEYIETYFVAE